MTTEAHVRGHLLKATDILTPIFTSCKFIWKRWVPKDDVGSWWGFADVIPSRLMILQALSEGYSHCVHPAGSWEMGRLVITHWSNGTFGGGTDHHYSVKLRLSPDILFDIEEFVVTVMPPPPLDVWFHLMRQVNYNFDDDAIEGQVKSVSWTVMKSDRDQPCLRSWKNDYPAAIKEARRLNQTMIDHWQGLQRDLPIGPHSMKTLTPTTKR